MFSLLTIPEYDSAQTRDPSASTAIPLGKVEGFSSARSLPFPFGANSKYMTGLDLLCCMFQDR